MRRRREDWSKLVSQWEASGVSAPVFARRVGVSAATVWRWKHEVGQRAAAGPALAKIVEIRPTVRPADDRFEVRLVDGRCVSVPASFDQEALGRLLDVLEAAS